MVKNPFPCRFLCTGLQTKELLLHYLRRLEFQALPPKLRLFFFTLIFFISEPLIGFIFCTQDSKGTRESLNIFKISTFDTSIFNLKVGERAQLSETRFGENTVIASKTSLSKVVSWSFWLFISNRTSLTLFLWVILDNIDVINQVHLGKGCKIEEKVSFENLYYDLYFFGHDPLLSIYWALPLWYR